MSRSSQVPSSLRISSTLVGKQLRKVDLPFRTDVCRLGQATVNGFFPLSTLYHVSSHKSSLRDNSSLARKTKRPMGARRSRGKSCAKLGLKLRLPIKRSVPLQPPGYLLLVLDTTLMHATVLKGSQLATSTKVFTPLFTTFESLGLIESSKVFKGRRNSHFSKRRSALKLIGAHPPLNQWF